MNYKIIFEFEGENEDEAFENFTNMMLGKTDWVTPTVSPVIDKQYEALYGVRAEGTD